MKKRKNALMAVLFVLTVFYPAAVLFWGMIGYVFVFRGFEILAISLTVLSIYLCVLNEDFDKDYAKVLGALITPVSVFGLVCLVTGSESSVVLFCGMISFACNIVITVVKGDKDLKALSLIISGLLAVPACFLLFFGMLFGNLGSSNVVKTVESPSGNYYAEVIDCNEGALGGSTYVEISRKEEEVELPFFLEKKKENIRVYTGRWGEFEDMEIYWKCDDIIVINSQEYRNEFQD